MFLPITILRAPAAAVQPAALHVAPCSLQARLIRHPAQLALSGLPHRPHPRNTPGDARRGDALLARSGEGQGPQVSARFHIGVHTQFGEHVVLVGSEPQLGSWDPARGVPLAWKEGDAWSCEVELPAGANCEYKYVVCRGDSIVYWQPGINLALHVPGEAAGGSIDVRDDMAGSAREVEVHNAAEALELTDRSWNAWGGFGVPVPASRTAAEEAVANADVGVFTYVDLVFGGGRGGKRPAAAATAGAGAGSFVGTLQEALRASNGHAHDTV